MALAPKSSAFATNSSVGKLSKKRPQLRVRSSDVAQACRNNDQRCGTVHRSPCLSKCSLRVALVERLHATVDS
jgi:hypothetical protein